MRENLFLLSGDGEAMKIWIHLIYLIVILIFCQGTGTCQEVMKILRRSNLQEEYPLLTRCVCVFACVCT